jgi:hypothetical protein
VEDAVTQAIGWRREDKMGKKHVAQDLDRIMAVREQWAGPCLEWLVPARPLPLTGAIRRARFEPAGSGLAGRATTGG